MKRPGSWAAPRPLPGRYETGRCLIRFWEPGDAVGMLEAIESGAGRGALLPWLPWVETDNRDLAQCVYNIERFRRARTADGAEDFVLGVFDRATGAVIGGSGYHRLETPGHQAEIGYWVRPDRHGQGLCTEFVRGLLDWGFSAPSAGGWGFRRIEVHCAAANIASRRVPEKVGMKLEAQLRAHRWVDGRGWQDSLIFGALADEWPP